MPSIFFSGGMLISCVFFALSSSFDLPAVVILSAILFPMESPAPSAVF